MSAPPVRRATIQVYSRPGCHLCEVLVEQLLPLIRGQLELQICNIDTNCDWRQRYGRRIPVVVFDRHEICHYILDKDAIVCLVEEEMRVNRAC